MPSVGGVSAKTCVACGVDCSNQPRVKDRRGRYFCRPCYEKAVKKARARKAQRAVAKPVAQTPPEPARAGQSSGADDLMALASGEVLAQERPARAQCPACGHPMPAGSTACRACGYGKPQAVAAAPAGKAFAAPSAEGVLRILKNPLAIFLGVTGVFLIFFLLARGNLALALPYIGLVLIYALGIYVWLLVEAFRSGVLDGVLCLICGIYSLYFVAAKCHNRHLQATYAAAVIANILVYLLPSGMEPL